MMQCVTCNKIPIFVPRLKSSERTSIFMKQKKIPIDFETKNIDSFLYEIKA